MMTQKELLNLAECYIAVEGYTDLSSILSVMSQEYPGEFDRKQAIQAIYDALKVNERPIFNCSSSNEAHIEDEPSISRHSSSK